MSNSYAAWVIAGATEDSELASRARQAAASMAKDPVFVAQAGVTVGDLRSTAQGNRILATEASGAASVPAFLQADALWMFEPGMDQTNNAETLESIYLSLVLDGLTGSPNDAVF